MDLVSRLEGLGHEVVHCPLIAIEPLGDEPIDVSGYDWVVVTSANGARELLRRASGEMPRLAAIGPATAEALGGADLVPAVATQEGLLAELPRPAGRVLFAAGEGARTVLPDALDADVVFLYRTRELRPQEFPAADLVVLTSAFRRAGPRGARYRLSRSCRSGPRPRVRRAPPGSRSSPRRRSTRAPGSRRRGSAVLGLQP